MADNSTMMAAPVDLYIHVRSPDAVAATVLSLLAVLLCLPPFVWHIKTRNIAASTLVAWVILVNFFTFINSNIWPTDNIPTWFDGTGLCDVEVKIMIAATVGIPGSLTCIFRSLAIVLDTDNTVLVPTTSQRRRRLAFEIVFCFVFPAYMIFIHYFVQPSRYYIFSIAGCTPSFDNSWVSVVLVFIWPPVICLIACCYCAIVLYRLHKYRRQFSSIISSSASGLNKTRFFRLFVLALFLILISFPVQLYVFYRNLDFPRHPYSFSKIHGPSFDDKIFVPSFGSVTFDRWIQIGVGFLVFLFFGFGKDATLMYRGWLLKLGFGKLFPGLNHPHITQGTSSPSLSSRLGSKARLMFRRKSKHSKDMSLPHHRHDSISATTEVNTPSPSDPMKTFSEHSMSSTVNANSHCTNNSFRCAILTDSNSKPSKTGKSTVSRLRPLLLPFFVNKSTTGGADDIEKHIRTQSQAAQNHHQPFSFNPVTTTTANNTTSLLETNVWGGRRGSADAGASRSESGLPVSPPAQMGSVKVKKDFEQLTEKNGHDI